MMFFYYKHCNKHTATTKTNVLGSVFPGCAWFVLGLVWVSLGSVQFLVEFSCSVSPCCLFGTSAVLISSKATNIYQWLFEEEWFNSFTRVETY